MLPLDQVAFLMWRNIYGGLLTFARKQSACGNLYEFEATVLVFGRYILKRTKILHRRAFEMQVSF